MRKTMPPLVRGGGFCKAKDGGVVFLSLRLVLLGTSLVRGRQYNLTKVSVEKSLKSLAVTDLVTKLCYKTV